MGRYDKFKTKQDAFEKNDPKKANSDFVTYLSKDITLFKPEESTHKKEVKHRFRFIGHPDLGYFAFETKVHFLKSGDAFASFPCLDQESNPNGAQPCPCCEKHQDLKALKLKKAAKKFRYSIYHLTYGIDRNNPDEDVLCWPISGNQTIRTIRSLINDPEGGLIEFDDPELGRDLFFTKGKINGSSYATINDIQIQQKLSPLSADGRQMDKWLDWVEANPITEQLNWLSYEEIVELLEGVDISDIEEDDEEEEKPKSKSSQREPEREERQPRQVEKPAPSDERKEEKSSSANVEKLNDAAKRLADLRAKASGQ